MQEKTYKKPVAMKVLALLVASNSKYPDKGLSPDLSVTLAISTKIGDAGRHGGSAAIAGSPGNTSNSVYVIAAG